MVHLPDYLRVIWSRQLQGGRATAGERGTRRQRLVTARSLQRRRVAAAGAPDLPERRRALLKVARQNTVLGRHDASHARLGNVRVTNFNSKFQQAHNNVEKLLFWLTQKNLYKCGRLFRFDTIVVNGRN
jgi:hypothetical protein